jgi:hypothetical protein
MKKTLLFLSLVLGLTYGAQAQAALIGQAIGSGLMFGRAMHKKSVDKAEAERVATAGSYQGKTFPMQRTPADKLPKKGAEQISGVEMELERGHTALLASDNGPLYTPEQRAVLQAAIASIAQVQPKANIAAYQQEAAFYLAEDARRQQAAPTPAAPAATN